MNAGAMLARGEVLLCWRTAGCMRWAYRIGG
jgi:hypothetical protein